MYTYMFIIAILLPRNVVNLHWQSKFFSVLSYRNEAPFCYVCWMVPTCVPTNIVHILYFTVWIEVNVQDMNFLKGGSCMVVQVAYKWKKQVIISL